jgi:site-specific recombinase XerD
MVRDMTLRGFSPRTHKSDIAAVVHWARYYRRSPEQPTDEKVQASLLHLVQDRKLAWASCSLAVNAFRFLYHGTLERARTDFRVPAPTVPQQLPEILSREKVWRLIAAASSSKHRRLLATTYAAGLRVSEVVALKVSDIDPERLTIRVEHGTGGKDRDVPLADRLLVELRRYGHVVPPAHWVFPNRQGTRPIAITGAQKIYMLTKLRAGIRKQGGIHTLRHAYATPLLEAGTDLHTVQRLLGHSQISTTMRDFHLRQRRVLSPRARPWTCPSPPLRRPWGPRRRSP